MHVLSSVVFVRMVLAPAVSSSSSDGFNFGGTSFGQAMTSPSFIYYREMLSFRSSQWEKMKDEEEEMLMPSRVMLWVMNVVKTINEENDTKVLPFFLFCFFVIFKSFDFLKKKKSFGDLFGKF